MNQIQPTEELKEALNVFLEHPDSDPFEALLQFIAVREAEAARKAANAVVNAVDKCEDVDVAEDQHVLCVKAALEAASAYGLETPKTCQTCDSTGRITGPMPNGVGDEISDITSVEGQPCPDCKQS